MASKKYDISMKCLAEVYPQDLAKLVFGPDFKGSVEFRPETLPIYTEELIELLTKEEIMLESVTYQEILEKGIAQGILQGEERGIKKGIEKGRVEEKEKDILFILTKRFKTVPKRISNNIRTIKDLETLEELLDAAITVSDIAEFEKHLYI
ncbi:MAG: hypothetical protein ACE5J9_03275 [Methanosarcinales archaeon]